MAILCALARRLGHDWGQPSAEEVWNEVRRLSPMHAGMSYARLEALGGIQWPCYDESHPGELFLHGRLWQEPVLGPRAQFSAVEFEPPVDALDESYPLRLTTGRHLESFNTGVQTSRYRSPLRQSEMLGLSPEDGERYGLTEGERVRVSSRRGSVEAPVQFDASLRPGLAFLSVHFPDEVATNILTIDATDPKSGTAEFKATTIRVEKLGAAVG
jgi:formate dehydrogenase major subunit